MFFFIDESGQDHKEAPYEILAGIAIHEQDLWNIIQAIQNLELEIFGVRLLDVGGRNKRKEITKEESV